MPITFEKYEELLGEAYKLQELMRKTESETEFNEVKRDLVKLAGNLRSDTGEFTPNVTYKAEDKASLEKINNTRKELKSEAEYLFRWAIKTSFENRDE